jgi:hypothetical protein
MKKYIMLVTLIFIISCSPKMIININDQKIPDNYFVIKLIESEIIIKIIGNEYLLTYEKGEKVLRKKELKFDVNNVKYETLVDCEIKCIIENPKNIKYNIIEEFYIHDHNDNFPTYIKHKIYEGKLTTNILSIKIPKIKKGVVKTKISIKEVGMKYGSFIPMIIINYI